MQKSFAPLPSGIVLILCFPLIEWLYYYKFEISAENLQKMELAQVDSAQRNSRYWAENDGKVAELQKIARRNDQAKRSLRSRDQFAGFYVLQIGREGWRLRHRRSQTVTTTKFALSTSKMIFEVLSLEWDLSFGFGLTKSLGNMLLTL